MQSQELLSLNPYPRVEKQVGPPSLLPGGCALHKPFQSPSPQLSALCKVDAICSLYTGSDSQACGTVSCCNIKKKKNYIKTARTEASLGLLSISSLKLRLRVHVESTWPLEDVGVDYLSPAAHVSLSPLVLPRPDPQGS